MELSSEVREFIVEVAFGHHRRFDPTKPTFDSIESPLDSTKPTFDPVEPVLDCIKTRIDIVLDDPGHLDPDPGDVFVCQHICHA